MLSFDEYILLTVLERELYDAIQDMDVAPTDPLGSMILAAQGFTVADNFRKFLRLVINLSRSTVQDAFTPAICRLLNSYFTKQYTYGFSNN